MLPILNCLTNTHKNHEIFPHFATLKIAFLVTFLYIFLHNHKDMVNLKNIFFQKPFFKFYHREKRQFWSLSDRRSRSYENNHIKIFQKYSGYLGFLKHFCKFWIKSVHRIWCNALLEIFGSKICVILQCKNVHLRNL